MICPVVVGHRRHLFEDAGEQRALRPLEATTFSTGVLALRYQPAGPPAGQHSG